jgi:hypothetical protein
MFNDLGGSARGADCRRVRGIDNVAVSKVIELVSGSSVDGTLVGGEEEGGLLIEENTFPSCTYPTQSGSARVSRVGECADKLYAWPPFIRDKNRMR